MGDDQNNKVEAIPFDDAMTKPQMIEHLRDVHDVHRIRVNYTDFDVNEKSKITKADMEKYHDRLHKVLDHPDRVDTSGTARLATGGYCKVPLVEHIHLSVLSSVSDIDKDRLERVKSGERITDKPLSQTERKVLLELINNDFGSTKQQMHEMAADALNATLRDLKDKHQNNKDAETKFRAEFDKVLTDARNKIAAMKGALREQGVTVDNTDINTGRYGNSLTFSYEAYDREVNRAKEENKQMLNRALMTLERQRLTAVRRVLIHGITEQAEQLLNEVPTAKQMMVEAAQEQTAKQITAS